MNNVERVHITKHAHNQYIKRVEQVGKLRLIESLTKALNNKQFSKQGDFMYIDSVWWVVRKENEVTNFVTCYGVSQFDIPAAKKWAYRHNDRINLAGGADFEYT